MKSITLPESEWKLVAALLRMAGEQFSNHGCNELPDELIELLPRERWDEISEEQLGEVSANYNPGDDTMMDYYADLIDAAVEETNP